MGGNSLAGVRILVTRLYCQSRGREARQALAATPPRGSALGLWWRVDLVHSEQVIKHIQRVH